MTTPRHYKSENVRECCRKAEGKMMNDEKQSALSSQPSALDLFVLYTNDMALSRLSPDEFDDYENRKEKAAAELAALRAIEKAARSLMDTFDEFGNFNYSSEYIDALVIAL